ncbi:hypothetical protein [Pseudomarimonas arenosa]|uniref:BNR repeat neuraminidase n=1 Tax=Pseudomarimonas arenosa TaxID=2774145 RepID=A0AAW3ZFB2_9GAMM|nr:hypothetical protein [Pseudomarimonas arenosa]MBD8524838.1 hypothetical protein [Pseudomarimonas arenosa]
MSVVIRRRSWAMMSLLLVAALLASRSAEAFYHNGFEALDPSVCGDFYAPGFTPVEGMIAAPAPGGARPAKGVELTDPAFGTCVVRATAHASEPPSGFARNDYSRRQAFNADNSFFIVNALNGFWHLYDAKTLAFVRTLNGPAGDAEPQWHHSNPNWLYYVPTNGGTVLRRLDVVSNQSTQVANFAGRLPWSGVAHIWTKSEGSPSADSRYWCFQAETSSFGFRGVFTYDLQTDTILGTRSASDFGNHRPDHLSMSASGRWCVTSHINGLGGTKAFNVDFSQSRQLHGNSEHSDLALGLDGHDYFVFVDYQSQNGDLVMIDLDTGVRTTLFGTYIQGTTTAYHVSGKSFSRPGWIVLSTYAHDGAEKWLHERIMAVELASNPRILNIAHHHVDYNGYFSEPHASVSRNFEYILFSSNWGNNSDEDIDAFMVRLPSNFLQ